MHLSHDLQLFNTNQFKQKYHKFNIVYSLIQFFTNKFGKRIDRKFPNVDFHRLMALIS